MVSDAVVAWVCVKVTVGEVGRVGDDDVEDVGVCGAVIETVCGRVEVRVGVGVGRSEVESDRVGVKQRSVATAYDVIIAVV